MKYINSKLPVSLLGLIVAIQLVLISGCGEPRKTDYMVPNLDFATTLDNGFQVPEGWEVTLWAESPDLYNPTNIDVDVRGRIWVTEAVNYRDFNNDPEKHLSFEKGDRVMILEDTDGDGVSDSSKVFAQDKDLVAPLGIGVVGDKIFVSCAPNLVMYTNENGDDRPDKKETFLTGFGGIDHDHSLHSLIAGPDGKWYFNTGNAGSHNVTDKAGWQLRSGSVYYGGTPYNTENEPAQVSDDGRIWVGGLALRMENDGTGLEVLGHNFRNSYEVALDSYGNMWQNDNDDQVETCRVTWLMEGGNAGYFNADGKRTWQADKKPGQDIFTSHWHQDDPGVMPAGDNTGAGSPTGVVVYEGDAFGPEYRGMLLSADAGRNVIFAYQPSKKGAGFELERKDLIASTTESTEGYIWNDIDDDKRKWFRPSDVAVGTDGAIYIADWYDPVVGGHQMMDTVGYGRIYRITPKGKYLKAPEIDLATTEGQIEALLNPAINVRNLGFEKLREQGETVVDDVKKILESDNPYHRARAVWLLSELGAKGTEIVENLLVNDPDPRLRVVAYRALKDSDARGENGSGEQNKDSLLKYARMAVDDPSEEVRREVAISLRDVPWDKSAALIEQLYEGYDGEDPWYLDALGIALDGKEEEAYAALLTDRPENPAEWSDAFAQLVWRIHPKSAIADLKQRALADGVSDDQKKKAVDALAFIHDEKAVAAMIDLSNDRRKDFGTDPGSNSGNNLKSEGGGINDGSSSGVVRELAGWWIDFRKTNDWFRLYDWQSESGESFEIPEEIAAMRQNLLNGEASTADRIEVGKQMAGSLIGGRLLLYLASEDRLPDTVRRGISEAVFENPYQEIRTLGAAYFERPDAVSYSVSRITGLKSDSANGSTLFAAKCAVCHKNDKGGNDIGPHLGSIGEKFDRPALLDAIIHPDASIVFGYEPLMIKTKSGQVFNGFLLSDGETTVLRDILGKQIVIAPEDIESRKQLDIGVMPDAVGLGLTEQDLSDLSAYLTTLEGSEL